MQRSSGSLVERMIGAARLDPHTYESVERDTDATSQALIVVVLAALAAGVGNLIDGGLGGLIGGIIVGVLGWILYAAVAYLVGTALLGTAQTRSTLGEVLRTLGFAQTPRLLLILAGIPILGWLVSFVVFIWLIATTVIALRQALDFTTGRAFGTALIAVIVFALPYALVVALFT